MIYYIKNNNEGISIFSGETEKRQRGTVLGYIKNRCLNSLFSYEGYIKACNHALQLKTLVPVYLNDLEIYFPIRQIKNYDNIFINYAAITHYHIKNELIVLFFDYNHSLEVSIAKTKFKRIIKSIERIKKYKKELFLQ